MPIRIRSIDGSFVKEVDVRKIRIKELLEKLGILIEEYVVVKNGEVTTEDDIVEDGDEIVLYPVVSGG